MSSIESQYGWQTESLERAKFDEWKKNGAMWQKEVISLALILKDRIGDRIGLMREVDGITPDPPFLSEIRNEVWTHFENLPPEETKDVGRARIIAEFERAVSSCPDLPEASKEVYLENLKKPFRSRENIFRRVVGLDSLLLHGEEDGNGEV